MVESAATLAERFIGPLGRRWAHTKAVATRAVELSPSVDHAYRDMLVASAWLHDVGYSPTIGHMRFHPLGGERFLHSEGWPNIVVNLVAHHSAARFEAAERGLTTELGEFPFEASELQDALDTADLTTGPDGQRMTFDERINEILVRYPIDDPVHRFWLAARPIEAAAVERTLERLLSRSSRHRVASSAQARQRLCPTHE